MLQKFSLVWMVSLYPLKETLRGFKGIIEGQHDDIPEQAFYNVGTIDQVLEKAKEL